MIERTRLSQPRQGGEQEVGERWQFLAGRGKNENSMQKRGRRRKAGEQEERAQQRAVPERARAESTEEDPGVDTEPDANQDVGDANGHNQARA